MTHALGYRDTKCGRTDRKPDDSQHAIWPKELLFYKRSAGSRLNARLGRHFYFSSEVGPAADCEGVPPMAVEFGFELHSFDVAIISLCCNNSKSTSKDMDYFMLELLPDDDVYRTLVFIG